MSWLYKPGGYTFGAGSQAVLATCHPHLQDIANRARYHCDFSVISGIRTTAEQQALFLADPPKTTLDGITQLSTHQGDPDLSELARVSWAMDIVPFVPGINVWERRDLFTLMAGIVLACATDLDYPLRWGGDWDRDGTTWDQTFDDLPHFELFGEIPG